MLPNLHAAMAGSPQLLEGYKLLRNQEKMPTEKLQVLLDDSSIYTKKIPTNWWVFGISISTISLRPVIPQTASRLVKPVAHYY
jgi:hypothetical protein